MLNQALTSIKGIGPKRAERFAALGLFSVRDLLYLFPRYYLDYSRPRLISQIEHGEFAVVKVEFIGLPKTVRIRNGMTITTVSVGDESGNMQATWYNQPYAAGLVPKEVGGFVMGRMDKRHGAKLITPSFTNELPGILPIYPLVRGLNQKIVRDAVKNAVHSCMDELDESFDEALMQKFDLISLKSAIKNIHFPNGMESLEAARKRLAFEDALIFTIVLEILRSDRNRNAGIAYRTDNCMKEFISLLPFAPTNAQLEVMNELNADMCLLRPMNRLIQGDVGSGKTILALYAMFVAMKNGYQSVLMAPTEILAEQHYRQLKNIFGERAALITGGMSRKQSEEVIQGIREGSILVVTGTHALIENKVEFHKLGLVITDEQHRFGVRQRAALGHKGCCPDALIMSATPIPRTLSLILYGDLDISIVDGMPPGRKPVKTRFVPQEKRIDMYRYIEACIREQGIQTYVVCPMIEENDEMGDVNSAENVFKELRENLDVRVELMHGRMKNAEKEQIMNEFRLGDIDLLVSTTVIEVGVDVPNACVIVIESADRFGLAQLHQLRGRVGRGDKESFCFLLSASRSKSVKDRLETLVATNDGFKIAEKDLETRGPGEFMGTRQHGISEFGTAALAMNLETLTRARDAAIEIMKDPGRSGEKLIESAKNKYRSVIENVAIN